MDQKKECCKKANRSQKEVRECIKYRKKRVCGEEIKNHIWIDPDSGKQVYRCDTILLSETKKNVSMWAGDYTAWTDSEFHCRFEMETEGPKYGDKFSFPIKIQENEYLLELTFYTSGDPKGYTPVSKMRNKYLGELNHIKEIPTKDTLDCYTYSFSLPEDFKYPGNYEGYVGMSGNLKKNKS